MQLFEWGKEFVLGIDEIDAQHKWLIDQVNAFFLRYKSSESDAATGQMLNAILEYMNEHFTCEEDFLERQSYPALESHRRSHRNLFAKAHDLEKQFTDTGVIPLDQFAGFLLE
ncbi:MAG: bacteriohemerythrin, partial [Spirochaetota bacterium]